MANGNTVKKATICAAISPYLAYWIYLGQPRVALKKLAIGIALCATAVFSVVVIATIYWSNAVDNNAELVGKTTLYADIAGFVVLEIWDLYLLRDVRKRIKERDQKSRPKIGDTLSANP